MQFEAAPAEGDAGRGTQLVDNTFVDVAALGLSPVGELPLVTLAYMLAQKLHACTDHSVPERENDRARDLIDIRGPNQPGLLPTRPIPPPALASTDPEPAWCRG